MPLDLASLRFEPTTKDFGFTAKEPGLLDPCEDLSKADLVLTLKYLTPREFKRMALASTERRAATRKGGKVNIQSENEFRRQMIEATLLGWKMTLKAAWALEAPISLAGKKSTEPVDFTADNVTFLAENSGLSNIIAGLVQDHAAWFDAPEDDEPAEPDDDEVEGGQRPSADRMADSVGNSAGGPSSSSASSPAATA